MIRLPLRYQQGHLFVELENDLWLVDTGAPTSLGQCCNLTIDGEQFEIGKSYLGLTVETLSDFVGTQCAGLLGGDVLGHFDHIFDIAAGTITLSTGELSQPGREIRLDEFMGIPLLTAQVGSREFRMFFDTGAQYSYLQDEQITDFPAAGAVTDFYPWFGRFETELYEVPISLDGLQVKLRCGQLPAELEPALAVADAQGIIGNAILNNRVVGYFPRRGLLVL